jgi:hypothetical protein
VLNYLEKVVGGRVHETRRKRTEDALEAGLWVIYPHSELRSAMRDLVKVGLNPKVNSSLSLTLVLADPMGLTSV